ncbi:MAG: hypothetical protein A2751_05180 [Candidatus Doudnabacteria bacterium RIFCSPHIGHO2_01_FULL_46_14]|uniref:Response regulatory domain-containing protein n=1 Tax=Candidatus Doudnabacteria bacterium RIFCSPHIGHO2_01_FULL_46_14 TaxID=1817824 RepID=A0A1F5NP42_9BACT|nr:MAG: hypothetical protein A2751_05180 [Candidatus Doudnabacteria bacterium RIFCSPHIGHO2_01_FULL_46_14]
MPDLGDKIPILVVDDDEFILGTFTQFLQSRDFTSVTASNVSSAIEILEKRQIYAVISDMDMPGGKSGIDLHRYMLEHACKPGLVIMTGRNLTPAEQAYVSKYDIALLEKPFSIQALEELLDMITPD